MSWGQFKQEAPKLAKTAEGLFEKSGWDPEGSKSAESSNTKHHLFPIDIFSAAFFDIEGEARKVQRWRLGESMEEFTQTT